MAGNDKLFLVSHSVYYVIIFLTPFLNIELSIVILLIYNLFFKIFAIFPWGSIMSMAHRVSIK